MTTYEEIKTKNYGEGNWYEVNIYNDKKLDVKPTPNELKCGDKIIIMNGLKKQRIEEDLCPTLTNTLIFNNEVEEIKVLLHKFKD